MFQGLKILPLVLTLAAVSIFNTGCSSSSAKLRIVQAIPDAGQPLDIYIDGNKVAPGVGFGSVFPTSGYHSTATGSRHLQVFLAGQTTGAIFDGNITLASGNQYTVVLTGSFVSSNVVAPLFTDTNNPAPTAGNISFRIIHASPTWNYSFYPNGMDVWVVGAPYTIGGGTSPTASAVGYTKAAVNPKTSTNYFSAPTGAYEVIATPPGLPAAVIIGGPYTFNSGDIRTVIFIDAPGGGLASAPLVLNDLGQ